MNTGEKRVKSKNNLLTGVAWGIGDKVEYAIEGSAFNAGSVIKWLRDELHMIDNAKRCDELAESVPDANGIYFVPAFTGLGAPYWDMYARGCIVGLTRGVNRAHIARSVLEAIAYQMTDLLEAMEDDSGITFTELRDREDFHSPDGEVAPRRALQGLEARSRAFARLGEGLILSGRRPVF